MHTVHVRVNDAATGKPTPCRIRFTDAEGRYYAPFGRLAAFDAKQEENVGGNLIFDGEKFAYIDGACEIQLPAGSLSIAICKGIEYAPLHQEVKLAPGKLALRFTLERWIDLRSQGWHSGETEAYGLAPHAALLEGAAEDLGIVNLLAEEEFQYGSSQAPFISNILAFSGQQPALQRPDCIVVVNTVNKHDILGRLGLLNCHRPVYPLRFGPSPTDYGLENWTLADWCDQCHRKGGLVTAQRFCGSVCYPAADNVCLTSGETLADLILGKVDAIDVKPVDPLFVPDPLQEWRKLLDAGFRIPLVGGSGKRDSLTTLGGLRTYAKLEVGQDLTYKNWIEAVRAGRTFVTDGPLLCFAVNEQEPGAVLDLSSSSASVHVRAEANSLRPLQRLEVIANGVVVAAAEATGDLPSRAAVEVGIAMPKPGWVAARAFCRQGSDELQPKYAHSSPVYVHIDGRPPQASSAEIAPFLAKLDAMLQWVAMEARFENDAQRQRLAAIFEAARHELLRRQQG
jgi:hypothetical protein